MTDFRIAVAHDVHSARWQADTTSLLDLLLAVVEAPATPDKGSSGAILLGTLVTSPGPRRAHNIAARTAVGLDFDKGAAGWDPQSVPWAAVTYETWASTPEEPRYRSIAPLSRAVGPTEWAAVCAALRARMAAAGWPEVDPTCWTWSQCLFAPTRRADVDEPGLWESEGPVLDVDDLLREGLELVPTPRDASGGVLRDPFDLPGIVGAFNRVHDDLDELIETFGLPYERLGARWRSLGSSGREAGVVELRPGWWYSHHGLSDPSAGAPRTAYDLVRLHRFGDLVPEGTDLTDPTLRDASHEAMDELAVSEAAVRAEQVGLDLDVVLDEGPLPPGEVAAAVARTAAFSDSALADLVHDDRFAGRFLWTAGRGWLEWDGARWRPVPDERALQVVEGSLRQWHASRMTAGASAAEARELAKTLTVGKVGAVRTLVQLRCLVNDDRLDSHPDLLVVGNGTLDLRTGVLGPHDPALLMTRWTPVAYRPGHTHPDWTAALEALPDVATREWVQVKLGQGLTGRPPEDDVMPLLNGVGSNGKTTIMSGVRAAAGEYVVTPSVKVLMGEQGGHTTELTDLLGARMAIIEETPEAGRLNSVQLKTLADDKPITARRMRRDTVTWTPSHTPVVATNFRPQVAETDEGTWRRLALVEFPLKYVAAEDVSEPHHRAGDPGIRDRVIAGEGGQHEAALAWLVAGARRWYDAGRRCGRAPQAVREATGAWRADADQILAFVEEHLALDPERVVLAVDMYSAFAEWQRANGYAVISSTTFRSRFGSHERTRAVGAGTVQWRDRLSRPETPSCDTPTARTAKCWTGVRFLEDTDGAEPE